MSELPPPTEIDRRAIFALLLATLILHIPATLNGLLMDDYVYIHGMRELTWARIVEVFSSGTLDQNASGVWWTPEGELPFYRPLAVLSFGLEYATWGFVPFGFHLTNVLIHVACAYLVWRLSQFWLGDRASLIAAGVFAIHPAHSEAVLWVSGRFDVLVCLVVALATINYMKFREDPGVPRLAVVLALYLSALGCKETGLLVPAAVMAIEVVEWIRRRLGGSDKFVAPPMGWRFAALAPMAVIGGGYIGLRFRLFGGLGSIPPPYGVDIHGPGAVGVLALNLGQYLLDFALFVQVDAIFMSAFWESHVGLLVGGVAVALVILGVIGRIAWRETAFWIGLAWIGIFTAPALLAMPGERNVYLAMVGVALIGGALADRVMGAGVWWGRAVGVSLIGIGVVLTVSDQFVMRRIASASDRVYADIVAQFPDPPAGSRIFVVNQCPMAAVGVDQAFKLWYGREDVGGFALSVSPHLHGSTRDVVSAPAADVIEIRREGGVFFRSFVERFLLFAVKPADLGVAAGRCGLRLMEGVDPAREVTVLRLGLPYSLSASRLALFEWDNSQVGASLYDLILGVDLPGMLRLRPAPTPGGSE